MHSFKKSFTRPPLTLLAVLRTLTGHKANIRCLDFHPYGEFVASGSLDTNVKVSYVPILLANDYSESVVHSYCSCLVAMEMTATHLAVSTAYIIVQII